MIIVQSLTNSFGEMFIAANVIVMRVDGFAMLPNFSYGTAMTTYAGQNTGAGNYERILKGAKQGTILSICTTAVITGLILIFGRQLMSIFTTDRGTCYTEYETDEYSCSGVSCHGNYTEFVRCNAWCG